MKEKKEGHSKTVQAKTKVNPLILQLPGAVALLALPKRLNQRPSTMIVKK